MKVLGRTHTKSKSDYHLKMKSSNHKTGSTNVSFPTFHLGVLLSQTTHHTIPSKKVRLSPLSHKEDILLWLQCNISVNLCMTKWELSELVKQRRRQPEQEKLLCCNCNCITVTLIQSNLHIYNNNNKNNNNNVTYTRLEQLHGNIHTHTAHKNNNTTTPIFIGLNKTTQKNMDVTRRQCKKR